MVFATKLKLSKSVYVKYNQTIPSFNTHKCWFEYIFCVHYKKLLLRQSIACLAIGSAFQYVLA